MVRIGWTAECSWRLKSRESKRRVQQYYYCKATGQQYYTYEGLMCYVKYAKKAKVGFYSPKFKSSKQRVKKGTSVSRKKSGSSSRSKPSPDSGSKPSTDDRYMSSDSPSESGSVDKKKDPDYMPMSESGAKAESKSGDPEADEQEEDSTAESIGQESDS